MAREILHCDMNNFFASVELLDHPELRDKPVAVAGDQEQRHGIVLAKNELAKRQGVKTTMPLWEARQCCPELVFLTPHHENYHLFSQKAQAIYRRYTNQIEPFGLDECWLDVTGSPFGDGKAIAEDIRRRIREELQLTVSVGVSFNKIFAKLGSDLKKPDAVTCISPDNWKQIVWPLPVEALLYVGPSTCKVLHQYRVFTVGQLAQIHLRYLESWFGKFGETLWRFANGLDESPVALDAHRNAPKSIGNSTTTSKDMETEEEILEVLRFLSREVSRRMREEQMTGSTLQLELRWQDLSWTQHQIALPAPTDSATVLLEEAYKLCRQYRQGRPLHSVGLRMSQLSEGESQQTSLYGQVRAQKKKRDLEGTLDLLHQRYGARSVVPASVLCPGILSSQHHSGEIREAFSAVGKK